MFWIWVVFLSEFGYYDTSSISNFLDLKNGVNVWRDYYLMLANSFPIKCNDYDDH